MNFSTKTVIAALMLAVAACAGTDANRNGADVTDLTSAAYALPASASVQIAPDASTIGVGKTVKLSTTFVDADGHPLDRMMGILTKWSSSDTTVATVSVTGVVTGVKDGSATITAAAGREVGSSTIIVGTGGTAAPDSAVTPDSGAAAPVDSASKAVATGKPDSAVSTPTKTDTATAKPDSAKSAPPPSTQPAPKDSTPDAPPPATTPPPTDTGHISQSSGPGLSGKAFLWDDYTGYRSTSDLDLMISRNIAGGTGDPHTALYSDGVNGDLAKLDQQVLYNGHPTVRYDQPELKSTTPELWVSFPKPLRRFWFRAKIQFSPGFTTDGITPNYGKGYKLFGWGWQGNNGRGSIELGNINQYYIVWGVTPEGTNTAHGNSSDVTASRLASDEWHGDGTYRNWYDYIVLYEQTSPTTVRERWWLAPDGQTPVLQGDNIGHMTAGEVPPANRFMMGMNFNQQRAKGQNQSLWYGQWELVDGEQYVNPFGLPGF